MRLRDATPADGASMLALIESDSSGGGLDLVATRRPDAYQSYLTECARAEITLAVDEADHVRAQVVTLPRQAYVDGEARLVGYVTGLHKTPGAPIRVMELIRAGYERSTSERFYCSILSSNTAVLRRFAGQGNARPICHYTTYFLRPSQVQRLRRDAGGLEVRAARDEDAERLVAFYRDEGARYSYFPVFTSLSDHSGLSPSDFYLVADGDGIRAAGALWDQRPFKQYVVLAYRGLYRLAARVPSLVAALGLPPLPPTGVAANFAHLAFILSRQDDPVAARALLAGLADAAGGFDFVTAGAVRGGPLGQVLDPLRGLAIGSTVCAIDFWERLTPDPPRRPLYFESGLL